jgi:hypothetical protein
MITIDIKHITQADNLDRPLLPYRIAKQNGIKKGDTFDTACGPLMAMEYIDWNPRTNSRFSGFACVEVK